MNAFVSTGGVSGFFALSVSCLRCSAAQTRVQAMRSRRPALCPVCVGSALRVRPVSTPRSSPHARALMH